MKDDFIRTGLEYLNNQRFAANFITKKYEELLVGAAVSKAREEALKGME
jgi:hypothetical protein